MSNYTDLNLYLVSDGEATPAGPEAEFDGENSVLVAATSPEAAVKVARAYDGGEIGIDNLAWDGKTIAVCTLRDRDTGDYL